MSVFILLIPPVPDERPDDLVGADYVARRAGCTASSVRHRAAGTGEIPRVSDDPLRFRRGDVHDWLEKRINAARAKSEKKPGHISLVRRKPRQKKAA